MGIKDEYLTVKQAAEYLGYTTHNIRILCKKGTIPAILRRRNWFIEKEDIENFIKTNGKKFYIG